MYIFFHNVVSSFYVVEPCLISVNPTFYSLGQFLNSFTLMPLHVYPKMFLNSFTPKHPSRHEEDLNMENVYYSEMKDAGFFDPDWE
ncbi:hypothetical protein HID58_004938 [Brassica napus]|uniref:Uncharacterized protein n=1 Tax=Brassica napus TaxID=3708 RepID=A0ABQ8E7V8_BRANA|nr:hypothetical protein HID58_004938 [Brassica napus]